MIRLNAEGGMMSHVGQLVQRARAEQRPRWSQQFLADELCRLGYATSREQIARFERGEPLRTNVELLAAVAFVLRLNSDALQSALFADYMSVAAPIMQRFQQPEPIVPAHLDGIPTRVPRLRALA